MKIFMFVSGGGHLDEALSAVETLREHEWILVTYRQKSLENFKHPFFSKVHLLSLFSSWGPLLYLSLLVNAFQVAWIFLREKPDAVFSTGSEIAVVPFYLAKYVFGARTIFLETVTRFSSPSTTAKWLYPVSDLFLVQWEELLKYFGAKAKYAGKIL